MSLSLPQRLALVKFLDTTLAALRKDLLPQAAAEMPPGSRLPAMFGRRLAGWVTMPKPSQPSARVTSEAQLLAWATANYPEKIEYVPEVKVDADLIEWLQEHRPESLHVTERVDPQWADDIRRSLADSGYYITLTGERLTEVPGIEVPEPSPSAPRVNLDEAAAEIIGQAWARGDISFSEVLELPAVREAPDAA